VQLGSDSQSETCSLAWLKASNVELGISLNGVGEFQPIFQVEGIHLQHHYYVAYMYAFAW